MCRLVSRKGLVYTYDDNDNNNNNNNNNNKFSTTTATCTTVDRQRFFKLSQQRLQAASVNGFDCLLQQCKVEKATYVKWPLSSIIEDTQQLSISSQYRKDLYSESILPDPQLQKEYIPFECPGDGNCLYR